MRIYIYGFPLDFSLSPFFQEHAACLAEHQILYTPFRGEISDFEKLLQDRECLGANVTIPFKTEVLKLCDRLTARAEAAGSVNTIFKSDGKICGDNTDGTGLLEWLKMKGTPLDKCAVLGNGGAARSIASAIFETGAEISIYARQKHGWEERFGRLYPLSDWKDECTTVNTLPFSVEGVNVVNIGYRFGEFNLDAVMMLALQGWLASKRWFGEKVVPKEQFISLAISHACAQTNKELIFNLTNRNFWL
ncbi:hypothetical protein J5834_01835 [bacterium]|nr:hypothetical protein [bacterium]